MEILMGVAIYLLFLFFVMAVSMVSYIFYALSLYTIAERRGIRNSWLAWLPIGNVWILGSISDQYQYLAKGKIKNRRKLLAGLNIGLFAFLICWLIVIVVCAVLSAEFYSGLAMLGIVMIFGYLIILGVAIVNMIYTYICLNDLYKSCDPDNSVLYLVLSVLVSGAMPFLTFACRKKDQGMPPRKQPAPQQVVVPTVEVVVDPDTVEKVVVPTVEPVTEEGFAQPEEFEE